MKKLKEFSLIGQAILVYLLSLMLSVISSPIFDKFYVFIFRPSETGGDLFFALSDFAEKIINGTIFSIYLFLTFFVFVFIKKKRLLIWSIGMIVPFLIALSGGGRELLWAFILSLIGYLLAQGVLYFKKNK